MASYEPLRVRAWLRSGVISDRWLPLDGILLYQATRMDLGEQLMTIPGKSLLAAPQGDTHKGRLPLAIVHGKSWYYRCSWAQWSHDIEGQDYWNKRFDQSLAYLIDFAGKRGYIETKAGHLKAYHMPIFYRPALWVEWYCVGDKTQIENLLAITTHLGKKASQGWGRVIRWDIESIPEDWSIWRAGQLMRGIPPEHAGDTVTNLIYYGVRPSYWNPHNQMLLAVP